MDYELIDGPQASSGVVELEELPEDYVVIGGQSGQPIRARWIPEARRARLLSLAETYVGQVRALGYDPTDAEGVRNLWLAVPGIEPFEGYFDILERIESRGHFAAED